MTAMRDGIAVTKAVVSAVSAAGQAVADPAGETPGSKGWRSGKPLGAFSTKRENSERLFKSARVKVIANEIDSALERYDAYVGNAEQREALRAIEQAERAKYEERRRRVMIPID